MATVVEELPRERCDHRVLDAELDAEALVALPGLVAAAVEQRPHVTREQGVEELRAELLRTRPHRPWDR